FFFSKKKTAYEWLRIRVGGEMYKRDSPWTAGAAVCGCTTPRRRGLKQVKGPGHNRGRGPAATT
ncbi:hypothetical protein CWI54_27230, partial [Escherichia coli]